MDTFFLILLGIMVLVFGYAQLHKGVVKTPGKMMKTLEEDEMEIHRHTS